MTVSDSLGAADRAKRAEQVRAEGPVGGSTATARRYDCSTVPGEPTGCARRPWRFAEVSWWCCPGTPCTASAPTPSTPWPWTVCRSPGAGAVPCPHRCSSPPRMPCTNWSPTSPQGRLGSGGGVAAGRAHPRRPPPDIADLGPRRDPRHGRVVVAASLWLRLFPQRPLELVWKAAVDGPFRRRDRRRVSEGDQQWQERPDRPEPPSRQESNAPTGAP
jgi:hypothetical protein